MTVLEYVSLSVRRKCFYIVQNVKILESWVVSGIQDVDKSKGRLIRQIKIGERENQANI